MFAEAAVLAFLFSAGWGAISPPIPVRPSTPGVILGSGKPDAKVKLEVFLELNCGDSRTAWGVLKQLSKSYAPEDLVIVTQQLVLPYHRNAYVCHQGYNYILDQAPDRLTDYVDAVFENLAFFSLFTRNMTDYQVLDFLAGIAQEATGTDGENFKDNVGLYSGATVAQWKYAVRRGAAGTPWYFINGVDIAFNPNSALDYDTLKTYIDNLLGQ